MQKEEEVSFVCQRCLLPLSVDESFKKINEHQKAELSLPTFSALNIELELQQASIDHFVPPFHLTNSDGSNNSFTMIGGNESSSLGQRMKLTAGLFDIISGNTEINHPLCEECTDMLLEIMDQHIRMAEDDCKQYKEFLDKLGKEQEKFDIEALTKEMEELQKEEKKLMDELASVQEESKLAKEDIKKAKEQQEQQNKDEEKLWKEQNKAIRDLYKLQDERESTEYALNYARHHLDKLKKTNVFNTAFHIWHDGHFGTINGLRLGRMKSEPVDWSEVNAAWGQTTLLLVSVARKCNFTFKKYKPVAFGSHSYIEVKEDKTVLPLYGSGGFRFMSNPKFDSGMAAFLDCLQQLKGEIERSKSGFNLPYKMEKGKIIDSGSGKSYSIMIQFNSEEHWTKALKLMLTNLKWIIAWVSSKSDEDSNV